MIEADFEHYYQRDSLDLYRGLISPRKFSVLLMNLPAGALLWQEIGSDTAWTTESHLLAQAVDALNGANWQRSGEGKGQAPKPIPRPSDIKAEREKQASMLERAQRFKKRKDHN